MYNLIMRQFQVEPQHQTPSTLRIRCPYCLQTLKHLEANWKRKNRISVSACHEKFWIDSKEKGPVILGKRGICQK